MKTINGSKSRLLLSTAILFSILSISNSCTKSTDDMAGMGGNTGSKGNPGANEVRIQGMAFIPSSVTVKEGTVITWTNDDSVPHTVTSDTGLFDSGTMNPPDLYTGGGTFSYTFTTAGTYKYHCSLHAAMTGTVIVN